MEPAHVKKLKKKKKKSAKKGSSSTVNINPLSDARRVHQLSRRDDNTATTGSSTYNKILKRKYNEIPNDNSDRLDFNLNVNMHDSHKVTLPSVSGPASTFTKADIKARELWHKKSGAGYKLFVQYYAAQPIGTCSVVKSQDGNIEKAQTHTNNSITCACSNSNQALAKKGQSRAAKKRRKKKEIDKEKDKDNSKQKMDESSAGNSIQTQNNIIIIPELNDAYKLHDNCGHIVSFLATMSTELPLTFRLRQHLNNYKEDNATQKKLEKFKLEIHQKFKHLVQPVPYDPSLSIYQAVYDSKLTKRTLGTLSPELKSLILESSSSGLIARQELGSMLPVIALHGGGHMGYGSRVLDMCSSPGSKMLQALEIVATKSTTAVDMGDIDNSRQKKRPGRVVANDIHPLRIEALKDAVARSGLSSELIDRIVYTNHDASKFPNPKSGKLFDCIVADVPCSGDGTLRKDRRVLSGWMPSIGNSLHSVQKKILMRSLQLVKVGGVVAYSTCSLNPVEDEAVVASVLLWANNNYECTSDIGDDNNLNVKVQLLEWPSHTLSQLNWSKGIQTWKVANYSEEAEIFKSDEKLDDSPQLKWYESFESAMKDRVAHAVKSMWPPQPSLEQHLNLHRCLRLIPQENDTGGFFVALLKRIT